MTTREPAAIYCRISDDKRGEGLGVARQEKACRDLADRLGLRVTEVLVDNDVSAYSGRIRPAYRDLVKSIEDGAVKHVLAWHNDRLHRSPRELEDYITTVEQHGVTTHFATSGEVDLSTASGRAMARNLGTWARYESEHRAERITAAHRQAAENGTYRGGTRRIFGYEEDGYTLRAAEATALREAYDAVIAGKSLGSIMRDWNTRGILTSTGKTWGYAPFKAVLLRPRNYGASVYRGEVVGVGKWEPVVDEGTWRAARAILTDPSRKRNWSNQGKWLMGGFMLCGKCAAEGRRVTVNTVATKYKGKSIRYYRCSASSHTNIRVEPTDEFIAELVVGRLAREDSAVVGQPRVEADPTDHEAAIKALRARMDDWAAAFAEGELTRAQHAKGRDRMAAELAELEAKVTEQSGSTLLADLITAPDVRAMWDGLEWKQKREIIKSLMTVTVLPVGKGYVRRFQPERLQVEWR